MEVAAPPWIAFAFCILLGEFFSLFFRLGQARSSCSSETKVQVQGVLFFAT
jgi:hypothetical protein